MQTLTKDQKNAIDQFKIRHIRTTIHKPACLINSIEDKEWILRTEKTFVDKEGEYKHVKKIIWDRNLPNGTSLYSIENQPFRDFIQQVFAQYINTSSITSSVSLANLSPYLMVFVSWVFLNDKKFEPNKHFLRKISNADLRGFFTDYIKHGSFGVLRVAQRVIEKIKLDFNIPLYEITNYFKLNETNVNIIKALLGANEIYEINNRGCKAVNNEAFKRFFNLSVEEGYGKKFSAFLRQFEPESQELYPHLLVPSRFSTEMPNHKTISVDDAIEKNLSKIYSRGLFRLLNGIIKQYPRFPDKIKKPSSYQFSELITLIDEIATKGKPTPYIPFSTATFYLKNSISLIIEHGRHLLSFYIELMTVYKQKGWLSTSYCSQRNNYIKENIPNTLLDFNISGFSVNTSSEGHDQEISYHRRIRELPTLCDLMYILFGACFISIGALLPYRINEFELLKHDCLFRKKGCGFYARKSFLKTGLMNEKNIGDRPIHPMSARAIIFLKLFRRASLKLSTNKQNREYLLFGLDLNKTNLQSSAKGDAFIKQCIHSFADFFEVPLDDLGRRWYANVHEWRKFFIINFFWCFKYGHMDTLRWASGHNNPEHLEKYLKENIGDKEFNKLKSLYMSYQLKMFNTGGTSQIENIHLLYSDVCLAFSVTEVSELDSETLEDWIQMKLLNKSIKLEMYMIGAQETEFNMALRVEYTHD
jgi:hypothetical protein